MTAVALPADLAPRLRARVLALLAEVPVAEARRIQAATAQGYLPNRCVICHGGGKLSGHHSPDGRIEWVHKSCHRRLHRQQRSGQQERP